MKYLPAIFSVLIAAAPALCDEPAPITFTTIVQTADGEPVIPYEISVKITSNGKTTPYVVNSDNGKFISGNISPDATVEFSGLEYITQTYKAGNVPETIIMESERIEETIIASCPKTPGMLEAEYDEDLDACITTKCMTPFYELRYPGTLDAYCQDLNGEPCTPKKVDKHAGAYAYVQVGNNMECQIQYCTAQYRSDDGKSCEWAGTCPNADTANGIAKMEYNKKLDMCIPTACVTPQYKLNGAKTANAACIDKTGNKCKGNIKHATGYKLVFTGGTDKCVADGCENGYSGDNCEWTGTCQNTNGATKTEYNSELDKCIPTACDESKYTLTSPGTANAKCVENKKDKEQKRERSAEEIKELQKNADDIRAKEQSTANKLIGAAGIGATGIGTAMVASAVAEQRADDDAERDMRAYLETFRCDYGRGQNIRGGATGIELPGGNDLAAMHIEYALLADKLARNKAALNLRPGIEAEIVIDKADTGLYDNGAIGKTSGAYASIARALQAPDGVDAAQWNALKEETAKKLKTGAIVAGVGAAGSLVANLVANIKSPRENSKAIKAKYADVGKTFTDTQHDVDGAAEQKKCSDFPGATGTTLPCKCIDPAARFFADNGGCVRCDNGMEYDDNNQCTKCPAAKPIKDTNGNCIEQPPACILTGLVNTDTCTCKDNTKQNGNVCECTGSDFEEKDGECKKRVVTPTIQQILDQLKPNDVIASFTITSDANFATGSATISSTKMDAVFKKLGANLDAEMTRLFNSMTPTEFKTWIDMVQKDICINVTGHTDRKKYNGDPTNAKNQELSENRAKTIAEGIIAGIMAADPTIARTDIEKVITTKGVADKECTVDKHPRANDETCRKVVVEMTVGGCK